MSPPLSGRIEPTRARRASRAAQVRGGVRIAAVCDIYEPNLKQALEIAEGSLEEVAEHYE